MQPHIREALDPDHVVAAGWLQSEAAALPPGALLQPIQILIAELQYRVQSEGGKSLVMILGEDPVALGQYSAVRPGEVHLCRLIVSPGLRRQGYGKALCGELMAMAVAHTGARFVTARVARDHIAGRNLCSAFGFQAVTAESDSKSLFLRRMHRPGR